MGLKEALGAEASKRCAVPVYRFTLSHPLVASAVVGATSVRQLEEITAAAALGPLAEDVMAAVNQIHLQYPNPNP